MKQNKKSNNEKNVSIYFCPNCKSKEVGFIFALKNLFGIIPMMHCKSCSYKSRIFPIVDVNLNKLNKKK
ncbi:MAG: hypothetical protein ACOYT4_03375 [Nanoarchaeota archaeon]